VRGLVDQEYGIQYSTGKNVIFKWYGLTDFIYCVHHRNTVPLKVYTFLTQ
jgi:hypothetical protein